MSDFSNEQVSERKMEWMDYFNDSVQNWNMQSLQIAACWVWVANTSWWPHMQLSLDIIRGCDMLIVLGPNELWYVILRYH